MFCPVALWHHVQAPSAITPTMESANPTNQQEAAAVLLETLGGLLAEVRPGASAVPIDSLDVSLEKDLGLDSLSRVELLSRLERRFQLALPEHLYAEAETPRDLLRAIQQASPAADALDLAGSAALPLADAAVGVAPARSASNLVEALRWHAERWPDRVHVRFYADEGEGESLTYGELEMQARSTATALQGRGLASGEPVVIMLPTGKEYFFSFFGVLMAGGIPLPIYPPGRPSQLRAYLERYAPVFVSSRAPWMIAVPEAKDAVPGLPGLSGQRFCLLSMEELAGAGGGLLEPALSTRDLALLQYTSGSTGQPKGVMLSHANLLANIRAMGEAVGATAEDVFVSWLPLYHDMGLIGAWLGSLYHGFPLVLMPSTSFLSRPRRWLWAIHRYRGTLSSSPNFGYEICSRLDDADIAGLDLSSWRWAFNGAEAVSPDTLDKFARRFAAHGFAAQAFAPVYGLAESSVGLAFPPPARGGLVDRIAREPFSTRGEALPAAEDEPKPLRFVACGLPLPGHQIRVVDEAGRELPERRQGRIQFQGPSATAGYYRDSAHTRELFRGDWLESGDLGYMAAGEVYVTGRSKDIVIRGGRNLYPPEIEQAVSGVDGIRKEGVAAFGVASETTGSERLIVLAETRLRPGPEQEHARAAINAVVADLIGAPPDEVLLAPPGAVLKTSSGKVRRAVIRGLYEKGHLGRPARRLLPAIARASAGRFAERLRRLRLRLGEWGFAAWGWSSFAVLAPLLLASVLALPGLEQRWRAMRRAVQALRRATGTRLTVHGLEHLPAAGEPFILVCNHASYLDVYALVAAMPQPVGFVAKAELARGRLLGQALRRIGTEFVERYEAEKSLSDARRLMEILKAGKPLVYFAEGTFTRIPGLRPFRMGAFTAAVEAGAWVVPVALRGTRSMLRGDDRFPHRGAIAVTIGLPLDSRAIRAESADDWQAALRLRDLSRAHILRYCGEPELG
ncbi:AMP-binding protein [Methyloterricola oryzae]|uniref:AMP-binding protein n=1 Tax=Methyloterricola oryzae TaxID=1495050 RepID=UPI000AA3C8EC|nr:AMP-binding protein [Methyloterricola oryzae]